MNNTIDNILTGINSKYNLKLSNKSSLYRLENALFCINLQFYGNHVTYWIYNKYGIISSFFIKKKIQEILDEIEKEFLSEKVSFNKLIVSNLI